MNEGSPENTDKRPAWEIHKAQSEVEAQSYLESLAGMERAEQIATIKQHLNELVEEGDNLNRFKVESLAAGLAKLEEEDRHEKKMMEFDVA